MQDGRLEARLTTPSRRRYILLWSSGNNLAFAALARQALQKEEKR